MKTKPGLEDKEQALIDEALRELKARKAASARPPQRAAAASTTAQKGAAVAGRKRPAMPQPRRVPASPTTPIDHPTVDGWDHPSARDAAPKVKIATEEKWARVAAAMEAEQRESRQARERMRRMGRRFAIGAAVVIFLAVITMLH
jgi:hypothetical protein